MGVSSKGLKSKPATTGCVSVWVCCWRRGRINQAAGKREGVLRLPSINEVFKMQKPDHLKCNGFCFNYSPDAAVVAVAAALCLHVATLQKSNRCSGTCEIRHTHEYRLSLTIPACFLERFCPLSSLSLSLSLFLYIWWSVWIGFDCLKREFYWGDCQLYFGHFVFVSICFLIVICFVLPSYSFCPGSLS